VIEHGKSNAYNHGCRCEICRADHRRRMQATRDALKLRPRSEVPHGTRGGYTNWGCHCCLCTTAATVANRGAVQRYRDKKRAERKAAHEQR